MLENGVWATENAVCVVHIAERHASLGKNSSMQREGERESANENDCQRPL